MAKRKLTNITALLISTLVCFTSCESTDVENTSKSNINSSTQNKATSSSAFNDEMEDFEIVLVSKPSVPVAETPFTKPFVVSVKHNDGTPYANYTLSVTAPSEKTNNTISYEHFELTTDESGKASYTPKTFHTSINGIITFSPKTPYKSSSITKIVNEKSLTVPLQVRFSLAKKHILVSIVDYDEKGRMVLNSALSSSSNLVGEFWRAGYPYQAQNADFHEQIEKGSDAVFSKAKEMVQGSSLYKYIVYGKVVYASSIEECEGGYSLSLTGTATAIDWELGKEVSTVTKTTTVIDKNKWAILKACQVQLAKDIANELIYSM